MSFLAVPQLHGDIFSPARPVQSHIDERCALPRLQLPIEFLEVLPNEVDKEMRAATRMRYDDHARSRTYSGMHSLFTVAPGHPVVRLGKRY
jgi:hypothetical protein